MSNTRTFTALIAFVVTFIFSAGLVRIFIPTPVKSYVSTERTRFVERSNNDIENFLLRDIANGENRSDYRYEDDYPGAVMAYWRASSSMDATMFPSDFQDAWREHMNAWKNYGEFLRTYKRGERSLAERDRLNNEINRTWSEVLKIGRTYGSNMR